MDIDLLNYFSHENKMKKAHSLLRSGLVYDYTYFLMTGEKRDKNSYPKTVNEKQMEERYHFDSSRDYATLFHEGFFDKNRLDNYQKICENELFQMRELLKDEQVRVKVVDQIIREEKLNKENFSCFCLNMNIRLHRFYPTKVKSFVANGVKNMVSDFIQRSI